MKTITISDKLAYILQRMIVDEINNQENWKDGSDYDKVRDRIIKQLEEDRDHLEKQGLPKFEYYY